MSATRPRPRKLFNRKKVTKGSYPVLPAIVAAVTLVSSKMRLTFTQPIVATAVPTDITANSLHANSMTVISSTVVDLGFSVAPIATNPWVIPATVTQVKSTQGGALAAANGTF